MIYCCDYPLLVDLPFLVSDKESLQYNIALSFFASYMFYLIQTKLPQWMQYFRYRTVRHFYLNKIAKSMEEVLKILTRNDYHGKDLDDILSTIATVLDNYDIFVTGCRYLQVERIEQTMIDALYFLQGEIHRQIIDLLPLNILKENERDLLLDIERSSFGETIDFWHKHKPGTITTVEQRILGNNGGGHNWVNTDVLKRDICNSIKPYIEAWYSLSSYIIS